MSKVYRGLDVIYPPFAEKIRTILAELQHYANKHMPGYTWMVTETLRTPERQAWLYAQGRTRPGPRVTNAKVSNHQSGLAADFAPVKDGKLNYGIADGDWAYLGHLARKHGLTWGGDWKRFVDKPHVEWPTKDKATYRAAREWLKEHGPR